MKKIHRRRNDEIVKEYLCTQGCGKAYGSYAALYTHIKNKHVHAKLPEMKSDRTKHQQATQPKRPPVERNTQQLPPQDAYDCNTCKKIECNCDDKLDEDELDRAISIMSDQTFIKFINYIGVLHFNERSGWIRSTDDTFDYLNRDRLREMVAVFNEKYRDYKEMELVLSNKWLEYLSYTSRVIDKNFIVQLYNAIFLIISKENSKEIENSFMALPEFETIRKCIQVRQKEWLEFIEFAKAI